MFAVIDVETTGLSAKNEKITEIAILLHDGKKITESFHSLVNPEKRIPYRITQITGINDQMVSSAPKFYELAKKIIDLTESRIIVGHNVRFDYNFLQNEFNEFDYAFKRKTLCTVKTSRKLIPGQASYSLGKLTKSLGIDHQNKHRALGDAKATAILLDYLLQIDPDIGGEDAVKLPNALSKEQISIIPRKTGVYYFLDSQKEIIYVGKSVDIHQRVLQHLNNYSTKKSISMLNQIADIKFTITGSELVALLLESDEIKKLKPLFNRAQRRNIYNYGLFSCIDENGYNRYSVGKIEPMRKPISSFQSMQSAKDFLFNLVEEYELCQKLCGLDPNNGACFNYQLHKCNGACIGKETPDNYNRRFVLSLQKLKFQHKNFIIIEKGPEPGYKYVVQVEEGIYKGFGIIKEHEIGNKDIILSSIKPMKNNKDTHNIINSYLRNKKTDLIIY
jgi:DNA polymerase-3 subunit epsilon